MKRYAVVEPVALAGWGRVRRIIQADRRPRAGAPYTVVRIDNVTPRPHRGWFYDHAGDAFQEANPGVATVPKPVTSRQFWYDLVRPPERAKAFAAADGKALSGVVLGTPQVQWRFRSWHMFTMRDEVIRRQDPETVWAVTYMETAGMVATGRATEILG